jgi:hypothetical protein
MSHGLRPRVAILGVLLAIGLVAFLAIPSAGAHTAAADCSVQALLPVVSGGQGVGKANVNCTGTVSWTGQVRITDSGGNILQANNRSGNQSLQTFTNPAVGCSGKSVHSFMWINVNGVVKSDTSGSVSC